MKTYSIEHVLRKKLAYVPGSVSNIGRLLMVIPLDNCGPTVPQQNNASGGTNNNASNNEDGSEMNDDLAITLNFYAQLFRFNEILEFNVLAVVDNRSGHWKRLKSVLKQIKMYLPQVAVALVVKSNHVSTPLNVKLWLNRTRQVIRRPSLGNLCGADSWSLSHDSGAASVGAGSFSSTTATCRPSTVLVLSQSKVATYVTTDQLPAEMGGKFIAYDHGAWLIARITAERYIDRVEALIAQKFLTPERENAVEGKTESERQKLAQKLLGLGDLRARPYLNEREPDVSRLMELGKKILQNLTKQTTVNKLNKDLTSSIQMAMSSLEPMTLLQPVRPAIHQHAKNGQKMPQSIKTSVKTLPEVKLYGPSPPKKEPSKPKQVAFSNTVEILLDRLEIEQEINEIRRWLANDGDRLIMCETNIGTSLRTAERLVDKHELIEMDCADIFARYSRLIATLDALLGRTRQDISFDASGLQMQRAELESSLRTFAMRIDRRRTLLLTCARFFRLLKKSSAAVSSVLQVLDVGLAGLNEKQVVALETHRCRAEILGAKTFEEGARLVQMLIVGTGRPDVVRDYTDEIGVVVKSSEILRAELEAMELSLEPPPALPQPQPPPQPMAPPQFLTTAAQPEPQPVSTNNDEAEQSINDDDVIYFFNARKPEQSWQKITAKETSTPSPPDEDSSLEQQSTADSEKSLDELVTVFVSTLEHQLLTIGNFTQTFSKELATAADSRQLLTKYQATYHDLERQWSVMNRCGLDVVTKIIKANSIVGASTLNSIENAMLELNRQFSQVRTLWKDIQINKVQSDIVKLLENCSRRSSTWSINSLLVNSGGVGKCALIGENGSGSRRSSGLPSSTSSSPLTSSKLPNNVRKVEAMTSQRLLLKDKFMSSPLLSNKQRTMTAAFPNNTLSMRRCFTSGDLTSPGSAVLSPLDEVVDPISPRTARCMSDTELRFDN